jgi:hypothetical protein
MNPTSENNEAFEDEPQAFAATVKIMGLTKVFSEILIYKLLIYEYWCFIFSFTCYFFLNKKEIQNWP